MREEYHGDGIEGGKRKLLYGWGTISANIWLPSVSELVGVTGVEYAAWGTYQSAMQGLNASISYWTDAQGGAQFVYFQQFNASGGGEKLWNACNQESAWLRSSYCSNATTAWRTANSTTFYTSAATASRAVHPAAEDMAKKYASCTVQSVLEFFSIL